MSRAMFLAMSVGLLRVVVIAPNLTLASELRARFMEEVGFEIVTVLESYPGAERLQPILGHFQPDCLFVQCDDLPATVDLLQQLRALDYPGPVVACALQHQPEPVIDLLRSGAFDYLYAPFDEDTFHEVALRVHRQCPRARVPALCLNGRMIGFTSTKPGSGATTLATQTAFALRRLTGKRVLAIDLNLLSGTSSGWADALVHPFNVLDALAVLRAGPECFSHALNLNGVSMLPAPSMPDADSIPDDLMQQLLDLARHSFDWVILDLPCAASPDTLSVAPLADDIVVVSTPELASLNTVHRATQLLMFAGVQPSVLHLALNRTSSRDPLHAAAIESALKIPLAWSLPNDYFSLQAAGQLGLTGESPLAMSVRRMASDFSEAPQIPSLDSSPLAAEIALEPAQ